MGHVHHTGIIIHTEAFYMSGSFPAGLVVIQIKVDFLIHGDAPQRIPVVCHTVKHTYVTWEIVDSLILDP